MHIPSSYSPDEIVKYCVPESLQSTIGALLDDLLQQITDLEKEVKDSEKSNELAWEQVSFARDLIESIDHHAERNTKMVDFKKAYAQCRADTSFEV